jgi:prepilin peptidase CpaA
MPVQMMPALMSLLVVAVWCDLASRRIPNWLVAAGLLVAMTARILMGIESVYDGALGALLAMLIVLPLFFAGGMGGGDAKLLIVVGAFSGPAAMVVVLLATGIVGGLMALAYTARRGVILPTLIGVRELFIFTLTAGRHGERTTVQTEGAVSVPYGVAIAAGTIFALWYGAGA